MPSPNAPSPFRNRFDAAVRRARAAQPRIASRAREAGRWAQGRLHRLRDTKVKRPSNKALAWTGGILATLVIAIVAFLAWFDWDRLRGPLARYASAKIHRTVSIDGHLRVKLLTWTPTATVEGLRVSQPTWTKAGDMIAIKAVTVSVRLRPLLRGRVILPLVNLEQPRFDLRRSAQGKANWRFSDKPSTKAAKLPPIQQFIINDGVLRYADDKSKLYVNGVIEAREKRSGPYAEGFHMDGKGSINGNPFVLKIVGGPMINIDPNRPYPFDADVRAGATRVMAKGAITKPFDFGLVTANLRLSGPDLADLYLLTGITLPNTPPYNLSAKMNRDGQVFRLNGISGRVGDSDLSGDIKVDKKDGRPYLTADLRSRMLDLDDLMAVLGGAPSAAKGETVSPAQAALARRMAGAQRLLPDATLQIDRLRAMDAVLKYRAASVRSPTLPVRRASLDLKLDHGVLDLKPFKFGLVRGEVVGTARIDGRKAVPVTDFDAKLTGVGIEQFIKTKGPSPIEGSIQARAKLRGVGNSVHKAAASANGSITLVVPRGKIRQAFAELLGINVGRGLYLLLNKDPRETELRCAVANFKVVNGVAQADNIVIDTGVVVTKGRGTVNLGTERMDIVIEGKTKRPRLLRLWAPITVRGPLSAPKPGVQPQKVVAQAGIAVALGAALTPLAAILPFVDPGLAKDADCAGLIAGAAAQGAPVKAAAG